MNSLILRKIAASMLIVWTVALLAACSGFVKGDNRANIPLSSAMLAALNAIGSSPGEPMLVRIFKQESQLEIWKRSSSGQFRLLKTYEICTYSGDLGPKFAEGDGQSPEGIYTVTPGLMNPNSAYYLSFNVGFPNKYDRAYGRTGTNLMVHGDCKSVGCYAMTDAGIAEIYALARETFKGGNSGFQLQMFPFRMTPENLAANADSPHLGFWNDIKEGYDLFELTRVPPVWDVCERQYVFNASASNLDPMGVCPPQQRSAALVEKMQADNMRFAALRADVAASENERAVIAARGEAINGAVSSFMGGMFGGGAQAAPVQ